MNTAEDQMRCYAPPRDPGPGKPGWGTDIPAPPGIHLIRHFTQNNSQRQITAAGEHRIKDLSNANKW